MICSSRCSREHLSMLFMEKFIQNMYKSISMHVHVINWILRQERVWWFFWGGRRRKKGENPRHEFREVHSQNIVCMQTRCYLNKSDPEVLMESIINKQCEVLTWCIPVAAGVSIYSGLVWILRWFYRHVSRHEKYHSSSLSGKEFFL